MSETRRKAIRDAVFESLKLVQRPGVRRALAAQVIAQTATTQALMEIADELGEIRRIMTGGTN